MGYDPDQRAQELNMQLLQNERQNEVVAGASIIAMLDMEPDDAPFQALAGGILITRSDENGRPTVTLQAHGLTHQDRVAVVLAKFNEHPGYTVNGGEAKITKL